MPTEQMRRYFHIASMDSADLCQQMSGAESSVVASIATHMPARFSVRHAAHIAK